MILLVIDMQKALVNKDLYAFDTFVDSTVQLVNAARKNGIEVIFVQHDAGSGSGLSVGDEGFEIIDPLRPKPGEKVFVKTINSCFGNQKFKAYMKQQEDKRLMIIGLQTNYCIDATVKSAFEGQVKKTVDRNGLYLAQTPQGITVSLYKKAMESGDISAFTDDASVLESVGGDVVIVEGNKRNIKITTPEDIELARIFAREE